MIPLAIALILLFPAIFIWLCYKAPFMEEEGNEHQDAVDRERARRSGAWNR